MSVRQANGCAEAFVQYAADNPKVNLRCGVCKQRNLVKKSVKAFVTRPEQLWAFRRFAAVNLAPTAVLLPLISLIVCVCACAPWSTPCRNTPRNGL